MTHISLIFHVEFGLFINLHAKVKLHYLPRFDLKWANQFSHITSLVFVENGFITQKLQAALTRDGIVCLISDSEFKTNLEARPSSPLHMQDVIRFVRALKYRRCLDLFPVGSLNLGTGEKKNHFS